MSYTVDIVDIQPVILAVAETHLLPAEVSSKIRGLFDIVYKWLPTSNVQQVGHNYAVYDQSAGSGMRMRAGFPVSERFPDSESVKCFELPAGRALHTSHTGPYSKLCDAYTALLDLCSREGQTTSGQSWEVYGDWHDDPSQLVTDLYFRLK